MDIFELSALRCLYQPVPAASVAHPMLSSAGLSGGSLSLSRLEVGLLGTARASVQQVQPPADRREVRQPGQAVPVGGDVTAVSRPAHSLFRSANKSYSGERCS